MAMSRERYLELCAGLDEIKKVLKKYRLELDFYDYDCFGLLLEEDPTDGFRKSFEGDDPDRPETLYQEHLNTEMHWLGRTKDGGIYDNWIQEHIDKGRTLEEVTAESEELKLRYRTES